jgi:hypothetical protein
VLGPQLLHCSASSTGATAVALFRQRRWSHSCCTVPLAAMGPQLLHCSASGNGATPAAPFRGAAQGPQQLHCSAGGTGATAAALFSWRRRGHSSCTVRWWHRGHSCGGQQEQGTGGHHHMEVLEAGADSEENREEACDWEVHNLSENDGDIE